MSAKRKAVVRTRWFWGIAAAGVLIWIVASNHNNPSVTTNYRPPSPSYSTTTNSPTTTTKNDAFVPVDISEAMPPVGSGLSLSRSNIRYCSYQGIRLEAARSIITTESQRQGFNTGIDDYNSRCSQYRYLQNDKNAVDAELPGKRYALDAEGRALGSLVSFQLPLSPIAVFAIRIELAHDVAIERLHHADARHHGGSIFLGDQD